MTIFAETPRLILREIVPEDAGHIFELDSDPEVQRYVGNKPLKHMEQAEAAIEFIRRQYIENGIGRWAVINKENGEFLGWSGLKLIRETINNHSGFYEAGYRFMKKYWGKGYATESLIASLDYGFNQLQQQNIYAVTDAENYASRKVLEKAGFTFVEIFDMDGEPTTWFHISKK